MKTKLLTILTFLLLLQTTNCFSQDMYSVVKIKEEGNYKYGAVLNDGTVLLPLEYDYLTYNGLVFIYGQNEKYGFMDRSGKIITNAIFEDFAYESSEGLIRVKKNNKWGFVDQFGNTKINFLYTKVCNFYDGLALVETENAVLTIDKSGKTVKKDLLKNIDECEEDMLSIMSIDNLRSQERFTEKKVNMKKGIVETIDGEEKVIIPFEYEHINYHNKMFTASKNGLWYVYNEKGEMLFDRGFYRGVYFSYFK